jgi:hypothetical protein
MMIIIIIMIIIIMIIQGILAFNDGDKTPNKDNNANDFKADI